MAERNKLRDKQVNHDYHINNREKIRIRKRLYRMKNKDKVNSHKMAYYYEKGFRQMEEKHYIKKYGINLKEYNQMVTKQNNKCKICDKEETRLNKRTNLPRRLSLDHDHKTGKIRDLLCSKCNKAIGLIDEDIQIGKNIIEYLINHRR